MPDGTPTPLTWGAIVLGLAAFIGAMWRASRTDKDATIAAQAKQLSEHQERERAYWKERESAGESRIRMAAAMESIAVNQKDFQRDVLSRLAALELRVA